MKYKLEKGVMAIKDGKAWGVVYSDGQSTSYGWVDIINGSIADPGSCKSTACFTYKGSHYEDELKKGTLVNVEKKTEIFILDN